MSLMVARLLNENCIGVMMLFHPTHEPNVADEPPEWQAFDCTKRVDPGGSIRLVCLETALPLANLLDRGPGQCAAARTFARRPERALGGETPPRCG
jgi:hypothetical protein